MPSCSLVRLQIEGELAHRIPSALTPAQRIIRPVAPTGVAAIDELLEGGFPVGAITEMVGPECSGRTSLALSFLAGITRANRVCAWIDASDMLQPESAAAMGMDLSRLLWVRCGIAGATAQPRAQHLLPPQKKHPVRSAKPWTRIEQALRVTDLLLQTGGFSAIVLDMASVAPEYISRVELATWFRFRAAAERTQASVVLLTQCSCAKSSGELLLRFDSGRARNDEATVFTGIEHSLKVQRRRFAQTPTNVIPLRKPPQRVSAASWRSQSAWAGAR